MVHNTVDYRYRWFEVFWDTGAIWSRSEPAVQRHSLGVGFRDGAFFLAVAFPVKDGRGGADFHGGHELLMNGAQSAEYRLTRA